MKWRNEAMKNNERSTRETIKQVVEDFFTEHGKRN